MVTLEDILLKFRSDSEFVSFARAFYSQQEQHTQVSLDRLLSCLHKNKTLAPSIKAQDVGSVITKWINKYLTAFNNRISNRVSNVPGTIADSVIDFIIKSKFGGLSELDLQKIKFAHRLSMSAENILGLLLEEFLAQELIKYDWHCCWGETIRSVDFCHRDGNLLQIKNRSNSENSSSSRVRLGTQISKWFRVDARTGVYQWENLCRQIGGGNLTEESFREFIASVIKLNPDALPIEEGNLWRI